MTLEQGQAGQGVPDTSMTCSVLSRLGSEHGRVKKPGREHGTMKKHGDEGHSSALNDPTLVRGCMRGWGVDLVGHWHRCATAAVSSSAAPAWWSAGMHSKPSLPASRCSWPGVVSGHALALGTPSAVTLHADLSLCCIFVPSQTCVRSMQPWPRILLRCRDSC